VAQRLTTARRVDGLTHHRNRYPPVSLAERAVFPEPRPTKLGRSAHSPIRRFRLFAETQLLELLILLFAIRAALPSLRSTMRKVLRSAQGPLEVSPQEKSVWICMCGLSKNQPFCDGSHKQTKEEAEGKVYEYDAEGHRSEV
jgi:CDGSH-type Zn-finger protein